MSERIIFNYLLLAWFILAIVTFVILSYRAAPYGRHFRAGWGPAVNNKLGWVVMEAVSPLVFAACFVLGSRTESITALVFLAMWQFHYLHRAFIYPLGLRDSGRRMPVVVMATAILFNAINAYLNGRYLFTFSGGYGSEWLSDKRFIAGVGLFIIGFSINRIADQVLRTLRQPGESSYKISHHRLYRWVSSPNYLGEIVTWLGWALATWSLPGLAFAVWTMANLVPRARAHHAWYHRYFPDYPPERKALLPKLW